MERSACLDKAKENVTGHRVQDYGKVEDNFAVIAEYWNTYLRARSYAAGFGLDIYPLTPRDVANLMINFKMARITTGTDTGDSYVDLAGYCACASELADAEEPRVKTVKVVSDGKGGFTYTDEGGM